MPSRDAWLVGLTNSSLGSQALRDVEDAWFEELLGARRRVAPTVELEPAALARLGGTYENEDMTVTVTPGGEGLLLQTDDLEATARPIGPTTFEIVGGDADRNRFDFPLDGFARIGSRLAAPRPVIAAVAAGHPATAEAGVEILAAGGNAADAAVAASLASCVAETVMTGLLGGGHAIYLDASTGEARNLDCFVAVPSGAGAPMTQLQVPFGEELVHYAVGASSCAVPGLPAGLAELSRAHGRLPWQALVEPALRLARSGSRCRLRTRRASRCSSR